MKRIIEYTYRTFDLGCGCCSDSSSTYDVECSYCEDEQDLRDMLSHLEPFEIYEGSTYY